MIVGHAFYYDNNELLKSVQHDEYFTNVAKIFTAARRELERANEILTADLLIVEKVREVNTIDHRTLQDAHDILAATYRYHHDDGGQRTLLDPIIDDRTKYSTEWNLWFSKQIKILSKNPNFVRSSVESVVFANSHLGYMAERTLCQYLIFNYHMSSWACPNGYCKAYE